MSKIKVFIIADDFQIWGISTEAKGFYELVQMLEQDDLTLTPHGKKSFRITAELMDEKDLKILINNMQAMSKKTKYDEVVQVQQERKHRLYLID